MPPDTNRGPSFAGQPIRLGGRKPVAPTCREEVLTAIAALTERTGDEIFTARKVYAEMATGGTSYAETTVLKTMQRMKASDLRWPVAQLERIGRQGFRLARAAT